MAFEPSPGNFAMGKASASSVRLARLAVNQALQFQPISVMELENMVAPILRIVCPNDMIVPFQYGRGPE